jgi:hypothetical protein
VGAIACALRKIASAFITRADFPALACLFTGGMIRRLGRFVQPSATIGNEFGPPERNIGWPLVFYAHQHATTFALHGARLGLRLILKRADAAGASLLMVGGVHAGSPSVSSQRAVRLQPCCVSAAPCK